MIIGPALNYIVWEKWQREPPSSTEPASEVTAPSREGTQEEHLRIYRLRLFISQLAKKHGTRNQSGALLSRCLADPKAGVRLPNPDSVPPITAQEASETLRWIEEETLLSESELKKLYNQISGAHNG